MKKQRLSDAYRMPGFIPAHEIQAVVTDDGARVIVMKRRQKKRFVLPAVGHTVHIMTAQNGALETCRAASCGYISKLRYAALRVHGVM